jgi:16S rRNA (cytidine1402-2'-O)-methyltransferase
MKQRISGGFDPEQAAATPRRYVLDRHEFNVPRLPSGLYVVATPIGNLRDVTLRALDVLAGADFIACEDTRVTRKLLSRYGISTPLTPYHDHNAVQARPKILAALAADKAVALVSDAGTPLVSDPGYKLVRAAREAGHMVTAAPGPSATLASLVLAGIATDHFFFQGFLPTRQTAQRKRIDELASIPATLVLFETGPRLAGTLTALAEKLGPRRAAICRELTKLHEEVRTAALDELAKEYFSREAPKGEIVIVIEPPTGPTKPAEDQIDELLRGALARLSVKDAVAEVAGASGVPRREVYRRALTLVQGS